ncbi:MAG: tetratricopeptide repeat protein [Burkholderiales bacterium]
MPSVRTFAATALLACTLAGALPAALAAPPAGRDQALSWLEQAETSKRAEAVVWLANHGAMQDAPLLERRLRDDDATVRSYAERALWLLWSRSGDPAIDKLMARGVDEMRAGHHARAIATFSAVIAQRPDFAEAWNKRATVYYLAGEHRKSIADCDEVLRRNPGHFGALSGAGQVWYALEEYDKALAAWRRALEVNPNMVGVEMSIRSVEELLKEKRGRAI